MIKTDSTVVATWNVLHPYNGVKYKEKEALTPEALSLDKGILKKSTERDLWQQYSNWPERSRKMIKIINTFSPSILCLQEVSKQMATDLQQGLEDYDLAIDDYHTSSNRTGEQLYGNAIFFDKIKVSLIDTFSIKHKESENCTRKATVAIFDINNRTTSVCSVHLRGYWTKNPDLNERQKSKVPGHQELQTYLKVIKKEESNQDGIFITGDFNQGPSEKDLSLYRPNYLIENGFQWDGNTTPTRSKSNERIDWVFYRKTSEQGRFKKLNPMGWEQKQLKDNNRPSDHFMTATEVIWG